jgi:hypothetical protein
MADHPQPHRRRFLQAAGGFAVGIALGSRSRIMGRSAAATAYVRRDIAGLDANGPEIKALRAGIAVMKNRGPSDVTSWTYQANIHGMMSGMAADHLAQCQHGHWWFFPWHRMYLYYFERILRHAIQQTSTPLPADFALPYWNYSDDVAARVLPGVLRARTYVPDGGGSAVPNPLFELQRRTDINDLDQPTALDPDTVSYSDAFALSDFVSSTIGNDGFGGQEVPAPVHLSFQLAHGALEHQPHDLVHDGIGGLMGDPNTAANDPVFWLHHGNIDRLWNRWLTQGQRSNPDPGSRWGVQTFTFYDENGHATTQPVYKFLEYVADNLVDYKYDDAPQLAQATVPQPSGAMASHMGAAAAPMHMEGSMAATAPPHRLAQFPEPLHLTGKPTSVKISVPEPHQQTLALHAEGRADSERELVLEIGGIDFNALPASGYYEVYINLPAGESPSRKSAGYLGTISTFALRQQVHAGDRGTTNSGRVALPLGKLLRRLKDRNAWSPGDMTVTFVPRELPARDKTDTARLTFRYVGVLAVQKAKPNKP